jgi:hypothetical protein
MKIIEFLFLNVRILRQAQDERRENFIFPFVVSLSNHTNSIEKFYEIY